MNFCHMEGQCGEQVIPFLFAAVPLVRKALSRLLCLPHPSNPTQPAFSTLKTTLIPIFPVSLCF